MRRCLLSSSSASWFLRMNKISPNPTRFYCSSSPSISTTPDSLDPKTPDSVSNLLCFPQTVTDDSTTKDDKIIYSASKDPMFGTIHQEIEKVETDPFLADLEDDAQDEIETVMYARCNPGAALQWYRRFQKGQPDWLPKNPLLFCLLLHILATASEYHGLVIKLLDRYASSDSCPMGISLYHLFLKVRSWKKMAPNFTFRPWVYSPLLTAYVRADRCSDAIDCLNAMLSKPIKPNATSINALLRLFIRKDMIFEAKKLYADIVSKGVFYDCETVRIMMNLSLQQGDVEESEKYLLDSIGHPPVQYAMSHNYTNAIDFACNKLESEGACALLWQMKSLGITPSEETYTNVICACVKKGNIDLALMVNEEMRNSGLSLKTAVLTGLMKGFILRGDLSCALELFDKMSDFGLCPDQDTCAAIIEGCVNHGNMSKAVELNNQMKLAGIPSSGEILRTLIKGLFKSGMHDDGLNLLNEARKDGVANIFMYEDVLGWFRKEENSTEKGSPVSGLSLAEDRARNSLHSVVATA